MDKDDKKKLDELLRLEKERQERRDNTIKYLILAAIAAGIWWFLFFYHPSPSDYNGPDCAGGGEYCN